MTKKYKEEIKELMGKSYHKFFPLVEGLNSQNDLESFIESYMEVMHERIRDGDISEAYGITRPSSVSIRDYAKLLTRDNLSMLARIYEANKGKKINKNWDKTTDKICPDPRG